MTTTRKKILIVDDDVAFTKMIKIILERTGRYEVYCENKGSKALMTIRQYSPQLVLLDVNMPDTSGGEILGEIQRQPAMKNLPVIFLTGIISEEEIRAGLTITGRPAIAKPINVDKLISCIEENLPAGT